MAFLINGILYAECFRVLRVFDMLAKNLAKCLAKNGVIICEKMWVKKREVWILVCVNLWRVCCIIAFCNAKSLWQNL